MPLSGVGPGPSRRLRRLRRAWWWRRWPDAPAQQIGAGRAEDDPAADRETGFQAAGDPAADAGPDAGSRLPEYVPRRAPATRTEDAGYSAEGCQRHPGYQTAAEVQADPDPAG